MITMSSRVLALLLVLSASTAMAQQVAITEFMNDPIGETDDGREWVEFYNYGTEAVNVKDWQLGDQGRDLITLPEATIQPGDFLIVTAGNTDGAVRSDEDHKRMFELEWLGGKEDPRVIGVYGLFSLNNSSDQLIVRDNTRKLIWVMAYTNDGTPGRATYLAADKFRLRMFGNQAKPGIHRKGDDAGYKDFLGFESNNHTEDPLVYKSDVSKLEEEYGILYRSKANGGDVEEGYGSPLKGNYSGAKSK